MTHMRLSLLDKYGLYNMIYSKSILVNTDEEFTIHAIIDNIMPNPTDIFIIQGRKFLCRDIKLKITPNGLEPEYQATLYAIK